jgi:hypothetical protein
MSVTDRLRRRWAAFFHEPAPTAPVLWFRRLLAGWTAAHVLTRVPHVEELYVREVLHDGMLRRWFAVPPPPAWLVYLTIAGLLLALASILADRAVRPAQLAALALFALLAGLEGATPRAYVELALIQWSLLQFAPVRDTTAPPWPTRLLALQFASVYLFAALAKLSEGPGWRSGEALTRMFGSPHYGDYLLSPWLAQLGPPAPLLLAWAVIAAELLIGLGPWSARTRPWALATAVLLHLGMATTLRISLLFHALMLLHLVLFRPPRA